MNILHRPVAELQNICATQKKQEGAVYRRTRLYCSAPCDGGILLFHTLTGMLLLLESEQEWDTCRDALIEHWFLVPETFDECAFADQAARIAGLLAKTQGQKAKKEFTILTTTDCNARCYYCYEAGVRRVYMTEKTAEQAADYIIRAAAGAAVELTWFGGEPLCNPGVIDVICRKLRQSGVAYESRMITNGYFFDKSMLAKAADLWYLKEVQITLDGTAETYDRVKAYQNVRGSAYERVMGNIAGALSAGVRVQIRLNVGAQNAGELISLADELARRFPRRQGLFVYASLLGDFKGHGGRFSARDKIGEGYTRLREKLQALGFGASDGPLRYDLKINACMADNDNCEIILPDGGLAKCDHVLGKECHGSVYTEERDEAILASWCERVRLPACADCPLYPRCIMLRKCAWVNEECPEWLRTIRINRLCRQMIEAYNTWKESCSCD